jgi:hypothetical protein
MTRFVLCAFLLLFSLLFTGCSPGPEEIGVLQGHVTIGPLVPVVREGESEPTPGPEVYGAREIVVLRESGGDEIARVKIDEEGEYQTTLPVGRYLVDINHLGIDSAAGFPKLIEIRADSITVIDVDIDTGIR